MSKFLIFLVLGTVISGFALAAEAPTPALTSYEIKDISPTNRPASNLYTALEKADIGISKIHVYMLQCWQQKFPGTRCSISIQEGPTKYSSKALSEDSAPAVFKALAEALDSISVSIPKFPGAKGFEELLDDEGDLQLTVYDLQCSKAADASTKKFVATCSVYKQF